MGVNPSESSIGNNRDEVAGISNAIINNMNERPDGATIGSTIKGFALAADDGNARVAEYNSTGAFERYGTFMQKAIANAINAVLGGKDYSNGATHWAGDDIGSKFEKRATGGLQFSSSSHDLQSLGSQTVKGAPITEYIRNKSGVNTNVVRGTYSYTWQTTAAYGTTLGNGTVTGTTFMRKTDDFINAAVAPQY